MRPQQLDGRLRVSTLERVDQLHVLRVGPAQIAWLAVHVQVQQSHEATQLMQDTRDQMEATSLRDCHVQLFIEFDEFILSLGFSRAPLTAEQRTQMIDVVIQQIATRMHQGHLLERFAYLQELEVLRGRHATYPHLTPRAKFEQAFLVERAQRMANGRLGHPEFVGKRRLG
jgi:hypothetical protein